MKRDSRVRFRDSSELPKLSFNSKFGIHAKNKGRID